MPLLAGSSRAVIAENVRRLMAEGKTQKQAVAIAHRKAGTSNRGKHRSADKRKLR